MYKLLVFIGFLPFRNVCDVFLLFSSILATDFWLPAFLSLSVPKFRAHGLVAQNSQRFSGTIHNSLGSGWRDWYKVDFFKPDQSSLQQIRIKSNLCIVTAACWRIQKKGKDSAEQEVHHHKLEYGCRDDSSMFAQTLNSSYSYLPSTEGLSAIWFQPHIFCVFQKCLQTAVSTHSSAPEPDPLRRISQSHLHFT